MAGRPSYFKQCLAYDISPCKVVDLTQEDLDNLYKSFDYNTNFGQEEKITDRKQKELENKFNYLKEILFGIEYSINSKIKKLGLSIGNVKLDNSVSLEGNKECITKINYFKQKDGEKSFANVNMNLNIKKLLNYPSFELSMLVYSSVLNSVITKEDGNKIQDVYNKEHRILQTNNKVKNNLKNSLTYKKAHKAFSTYAMGFLEDVNKKRKREFSSELKDQNIALDHSGDFIEFDEASVNLVTEMYLENFSEEQIKQLASWNFGIDDLTKSEIIAKFESNSNQYRENYEKLCEKRLEILHNKQMEYRGKDEGVLEALESQYLNLVDTRLGDKFNDLKQGLQNGDKSELQTYVRQYADNMIDNINELRKANGLPLLDRINVAFVNEPNENYMGQYHEGSDGQKITINMAKVHGIVDLTVTMSHELTHYIDSAKNRSLGRIGKYGTGLLNDMSENISGSGFDKNSDAYKLLNKINKYCYVVNPNERRARLNELESYKFMLQFADNDPLLKKQLTESIEGKYNPKTQQYENGFIQYQQKTIKHIVELDIRISEFEAEFANISAMGNSKGCSMIRERIEYLKEIKQQYQIPVNDLAEFKAIEQARNELNLNRSEFATNSANDKIYEVHDELNGNTSNKKQSDQAKKHQENLEKARKLKEQAEIDEAEKAYQRA